MAPVATSLGRAMTGCLLWSAWLSFFGDAGFTPSVAGAEWPEGIHDRWTEVNPGASHSQAFQRLAPQETGVAFVNKLGEAAIAGNRVLANGSGVAVGDYDGDGKPDLYFCGLESPNRLFRNLGNWKFQDVTDEAGVACSGQHCRGAVFADLNGDSKLDLLVSTHQDGVKVFLNKGEGQFRDQTSAAGTRSRFGSMTLALADVDGDGTLDLYVTNNRPDDVRDRGRLAVRIVNGQPVVPGEDPNRFLLRHGQLAEYGQPDQLFLNDGTGRFREVKWTSGRFLDEEGQPLAAPPGDWGLSAAFRDVNGDLAPDLYVCNDFWTPDRFWINQGQGRFRAMDRLALRKTSASSMGVDFADFDRDGHLDFFVVDMLSRDPVLRKRQMLAEKPAPSAIGAIEDRPQVMRNTFFKNRGDGTYAEMALFSHLAASDWSWSPLFLDVDLDGFEDLLISAGHFRDVQDLDAARLIQARQHSWDGYPNEEARRKAYTQELMEHYRLYPPLDMPIVAFRNQGDGTFVESTVGWGFLEQTVHHGMAAGDFDLDGDLDLAVNVLNGPAALYRNTATGPRVAVKLIGKSPNTQGIGAQVTLENGAVRAQTLEAVSGGRYLSGSEPLLVFAAHRAGEPMSLTLRWRDGAVQTVENIQPNRIYEIRQSGQPAKSPVEKRNPPSFFQDVSSALAHVHAEPAYDDFSRQPLLPFRLSQRGPSAAWFDLDGDEHDDLIIGAGSGQAPAVFRSNGQGEFQPVRPGTMEASASDLAGLAGWTDSAGQRYVMAGLTGYEAPASEAVRLFQIRSNQLVSAGALGAEMKSASCLALGDFNGKGELALFVGGGVEPGQYPLGAPSKIFHWQNGQWQVDARNSVLLERLGVVNGAVWSDLTGDGLPELVLACAWAPIRVFQNRNGLLFETTQEWGLASHTGWWQGVTTGDFDNDGALDIAASNWGLNSPYQASSERPLVLIHGQLSQPGQMDLIETEYPAGGQTLAPMRQIMPLGLSMPFVFEQFASHKAYSEATLDQVLGERKVLSQRVSATTLASTVFLNRAGRFEPMPLPREAQLAPAFGLCVGDLDGDGTEDLFLSQNFFATQPEVARLDAGRGLWLKGDGRGGFTPVPGHQSGLQIYGEQRGAALGDFNEDGRIDLVVTQNGAGTKLYQNALAKPGLRVRLKGSSSNPRGIGAVLRLEFGDRRGPAREIHAGSGYGSQDSLTQVLAAPEPPTALWVRWPGGVERITPIPEGERELTVDGQGRLIP